MRTSNPIPRGLRRFASACALVTALAACGDDPVPGADSTPGDVAADVVDVRVDATADATPDVLDATPGDVVPVDVDDTVDVDADATIDDADDADDADALDGEDADVVDVDADVDDTTADADDTMDGVDTIGDAEDTTADAADIDDTDDVLDIVDIVDIGDIGDIGDGDDDEASAAGPFDDLAGLTGDTLRAALLDRIDDQTPLGYSGDGLAREVMWAVIDVHDGRLECIYTGRTVAAEDATAPPLGTAALPAIDTTPDHDCRLPDGTASGCLFNAEHSWPRSKGADSGPAESDLHHLFPAYDVANNRRSSYDFGETDCAGSACEWSENGSELGERGDGTKVFQVRSKYQGDIARAQLYFAVRYQKAIDATVETTLRAWHAADPVSDEERVRNDAIEEWQGNRNPFVDRPDFVDAITNF